MITIMPTQEIMKCVLDKNITSEGAIRRRKSFDEATLLLVRANIKILFTSTMWENNIEHRLEEDHISVFESLYDFDKSTKGLPYDVIASINWVARSECKSRNVIIITENKTTHPKLSNSFGMYL